MKSGALVIVSKVLIALLGAVIFAASSSSRAQEGDGRSGSPRLSTLLGDEEDGFPKVLEARPFSFPADHGPHPEFRNEWWYLTGNLDTATGERFGFELTIFRFALAPASGMETPPGEEASAWRTRQVYIGHFAITDAANGEFHVAERYARGAVGLAGATAEPFRVWLENWWLKEFPGYEASPTAWLLHADSAEMALTLTLVAAKPPVLNGIEGLSQKSAEPGNASYYYSISRLDTRGTLRVGDRVYDVTGLSWFDREWGSSALSDEQQGWDWFALQLSDGSELMFYRLRRRDGTVDQWSAGTWIPAKGDSVHLANEDVDLEIRDHWESPEGGRYPVAWTIRVPKLQLTLQVNPVIEQQELVTGVRYWEGAVDVSGRRKEQDIGGRGYVELTGYAE